jgi:hypothetical protein
MLTGLAPMTFNMPRGWHFEFKMEATRLGISMHELLKLSFVAYKRERDRTSTGERKSPNGRSQLPRDQTDRREAPGLESIGRSLETHRPKPSTKPKGDAGPRSSR